MADGENKLDLAELWLPVMAETSHLRGQFRAAGTESRQEFDRSFTGAGSNFNEVGNRFSSQLREGFVRGLGNTESLGIARFTETISRGFEGMRRNTEQAETALRSYRQAQQESAAATSREIAEQQKLNALKNGSAAGDFEVQRATRAVATARGVSTKALIDEQTALSKYDIAQKAKTDAAVREAKAQKDLDDLNAKRRKDYQAIATAQAELTNARKAATAAATAEATTEGNVLKSREKAEALTLKVAEAERQLNKVREGSHASTSQILSAENAVAAARVRSEAAARAQVEAHDRLTVASKNSSGGLMQFALASGAISGGVTAAVNLAAGAMESFIDVLKEGFEKGIEITTEFAKQLVEIGETFEHIKFQIIEFSTASGERLESLEASARNVFSTLDVDGSKVGETMAVLAQRLGLSGTALEDLTRHVTELGGRYGAIDTDTLGGVFRQFSVDGEHADDVLASFLQSARSAGLNGITPLLAPLASGGELMVQLGLNAQQAGKFVSDLEKNSLPATKILTAMGRAEKFFAENNIDFKTGIQQTVEDLNRYAQAGDKIDAEKLAMKVFGMKGWAQGSAGAKILLDIMHQMPDAFNATGSSIDEFTDKSQGLDEKWTSVMNKLKVAVLPVGSVILDRLGGAVDKLSTYFKQHGDKIKAEIHSWGDKFIDLLPTIQTAIVFMIKMFGDFANFMAIGFQPIANGLYLAAEALLILNGHFKEAGELTDVFMKYTKTVWTGGISEQFDSVAKKVEGLRIDTKGLHDDLQNAFDVQAPDWWGTGAKAGIGGGEDNSAQAKHLGGESSGSGGGSASGGDTGTFPGVNGRGNSGSGNSSASPQQSSNNGKYHPDWNAIAQKESSGNWQNADTGHNGHFGGLQISPTTWNMFGGSEFADRPDRATREQQITVAERILNGWNGTPGQGPNAWENGKTYVALPGFQFASGGAVPGSAAGAMSAFTSMMQPPNSSDTMLSWLTPGEFVVNKASTARFYDVLHAINKAPHFDGGGSVSQVIWNNTESGQKIGEANGKWVGPGTDQPGYYRDDWGGHTGHVHTTFMSNPFTGEPYNQIAPGTDIRQGASGFPAWVYELGRRYGLEASTYPGHQERAEWGYRNRGIDWWPAGHGTMSGANYSHEDRQILDQFATDAGRVGTGESGGHAGRTSGGVQASGYGTGSGSGSGGSGDSSGGFNSPTTGLPFKPGTYGGYDTVEEFRKHRDQGQRLDQLNSDLDRENARVRTLQGEYNDLDAVHDITRNSKDISAKQQEIDDAKRQAAHIQQEIGDLKQDMSLEASKPKKGKSNQYESMAEQFGGGFLKGIGQELGFGDLFKSPLDFGIVKLLTGAAGWGISQLEGAAGARADGGPGGAGPGILNGMLKDIVPQAMVPQPRAPIGAAPGAGVMAPGVQPSGNAASDGAGGAGDAGNASQGGQLAGLAGAVFNIAQNGMFLDNHQAKTEIMGAVTTGTSYHPAMTPAAIV